MISLPLAKLSTARDATADETKFQWNHETQDLVVVFDNFGAHTSTSQLFKVVQGTQIRVRASQNQPSRMQSQVTIVVCRG
jgi:hypothetical protein